MSYKIGPVLMTPQAAVCLLECNASNRPKRSSHIEHLASIIRRGEFRATNDAVTVLEDGTLANGQHRLMAIVFADIPAPILLAAPDRFFVGLQEIEMVADKSLASIMDCGATRSMSDRTGLRRTMTHLIMAWFKHANKRRNAKVTAQQVECFYQQHKAALDWADTIRPKDRGIGRVHVWLALMEFFEFAPLSADKFARALITPTPPIQQAALLRERLLRIPGGFGGDNGAYFRATYNTTIYCINKWLEGVEIRAIHPCGWNKKAGCKND